MTSFDPYYQWLGIRDPQRPPNHYRLLGVELFESNADVITTAADRQMAHLRTYRHGENVELSERLLNEVSAARVCLLDPEKKSQYDRQLRESQTPDAPPVLPPKSQEQAADPELVVAPDEGIRKYRGGRTGRHVPTLVLIASVVILGVIAFIRYGPLTTETTPLATVSNQLPDEKVPDEKVPDAQGDDAQVDDAQVDEDVATPGNESRPDAETDPPPQEREPADTEPTPTVPRDDVPQPVRQPAPWAQQKPRTIEPPKFSAAEPDGAVLLAMSRRKLDDARNLLASLEQQEPLDSRRRVDSLRLLLYAIERFWESYERARDDLHVGDTLQYNGQPTVVASILGTKLELQALNGERETFNLGPELIDRDLLIALVERRFQASPPTAWRMIGLFLAVDRVGDLHLAQEYLVRAGRQGFEAEFLVRAIDDLATQATGRVVTVPTGGEHDNQPRNGRRPIPSDAEQSDVKRHLQANGELDRVASACIEAARDHDGVARYVLLSEAARKSVATQELDVGLLAIDELDEHFAVDVWHLRFELMRRMTRGDGVPRRQLADGAVALARQAVLADQYAQADRFAKMAVSLASPLRDAHYSKQLVQRRQRIKQIEREYRKTRDAARLLANKPDDPSANLAIGGFLCFTKGDFAAGLPHLRLGSDADLRSLAARDLANPTDVTQRGEVAAGWAKQGEELTGLRKLHALERARFWYDLALKKRASDKLIRDQLGQVAWKIGQIEGYLDLTTVYPNAATVGYGSLGINRNLELRIAKIRELPQVAGEPISRYLWAHGPSKIAYQVPTGARTFAAVGVLNADSTDGVRFQVEVDGQRIFNSPVLTTAGQRIPIRVQLPKNGQQLVLIVDAMKASTNDQTYWVNPVVMF